MPANRSMQLNLDTNGGAPAPLVIDSGASGRGLPSQVVVAGLLFVLSAGVLMGMRAYGTRSGVNFEQVSAESTYKDDADKTAAYDRIMADLARVNKPLDVPLDDSGHSPFMARISQKTVPATQVTMSQPKHVAPVPVNEGPEEKADRMRSARKAELVNEVSRLELHTVMGGRVPLARIDEETVGINGTVGPFTVVAIEGRSVTLEAEGMRFNLTMQTFGEQQHQKKPSGKR